MRTLSRRIQNYINIINLNYSIYLLLSRNRNFLYLLSEKSVIVTAFKTTSSCLSNSTKKNITELNVFLWRKT